MVDMPSCFGTVKSPQERAENDCVTCRYVRQCDTVETEIRSLRAQVEQERAGIVALLRAKAGVFAAAQFGVCAALLLDQAVAIERHEDKEPSA